MVDTLSTKQRSANMARIRSRDTKPELVVRKIVHGLGYRFRLHRRDLPGSPDLSFASSRKTIFVNGCFWHRHPGCKFSYDPKTNAQFWQAKFARTVARDVSAREKLIAKGWDVLTVWECELKDVENLTKYLDIFLGRNQVQDLRKDK